MSEDFTKLNMAELGYRYGSILDNLIIDNIDKKACEDEFIRRERIKNKRADATGGRIGPYEMVAKETEEINEQF